MGPMRYERASGVVGAVAISLLLAFPSTVAAQNGTKLFRACYVPEIGALYLIGETGLPPACLSGTHEQISWTESGSGAVTILDGSITTEKLAEKAVTREKIETQAVASDQIANDAVSGKKVADGSIEAVDLENGAVTADKVATNAITTAKVASDAITSDKLADGAVGATKVANGAVTGSKLANGAVSAAKIANGAVVSNAIKDGAVISTKIAKDAVTDFGLAPNAVGAGHIASGGVGRSELQDGAVDGSKLDVRLGQAIGLTQTVPANSVRTLSATCDGNRDVIGGGYSSSPQRAIATGQRAILGTTWEVDIWNQTPGGINVSVFAICADLRR